MVDRLRTFGARRSLVMHVTGFLTGLLVLVSLAGQITCELPFQPYIAAEAPKAPGAFISVNGLPPPPGAEAETQLLLILQYLDTGM